MSRSKTATATSGIPVLKSYRMCRKSNVKPPAAGDNANWERLMSRPPYPIHSLDINHIGSYTSHAHDFQSPDNIIMVRSTDQRTIAEKKGTQPPKIKTEVVTTVETFNRTQNTVRKLTTKSVDGVVESKETIVTDMTRAPLLGSQVNLRAEKLKSPPSYASTPSKSQTLPRQSSNLSIRSVPRTPQKNVINREEFTKQCLERHNEYRARHKLDPLKLSHELSAFAQEWADHLASILKMMHRPNNKYGENLWMYMTTDRSHRVAGGDAVDSWYNEELPKYKFGTEPRNLEAGHLTQVLWASSEYLGVGVAKTGEYTFVVCNYNPPGNYKGEYVENVPPIGGWKGSSRPSHHHHSASSSGDSQDTFIKDTLRIHNEYRAIHGVPPLTLDANITNFAQNWADQLAAKNQFFHRPSNPYGENLFWSSDAASAKVTCDSWYNEVAGYNYDVDPFRGGGGAFKAGHFTQMVWKDSSKLGVGRAFTKSGAMIAVANYSPRGNIIGEFTTNVLPPGGGGRRR